MFVACSATIVNFSTTFFFFLMEISSTCPEMSPCQLWLHLDCYISLLTVLNRGTVITTTLYSHARTQFINYFLNISHLVLQLHIHSIHFINSLTFHNECQMSSSEDTHTVWKIIYFCLQQVWLVEFLMVQGPGIAKECQAQGKNGDRVQAIKSNVYRHKGNRGAKTKANTKIRRKKKRHTKKNSKNSKRQHTTCNQCNLQNCVCVFFTCLLFCYTYGFML